MKKYFFLLCFLLFSTSIFAQILQKEYTISKPLLNANEPSIAINPIDHSKKIVATNNDQIYRTKNNGKKFHYQKATSSLGVYGDPVLLYDAKEICYYVHLAKNKEKKWPESFDQIVIQQSKNNGKTWNDGIGIGKNGKMQDKAWISIDNNKKSPFYGNIYISWTEFDKYRSDNTNDSSRILFTVGHTQSNDFSLPKKVNQLSGNCMDSDSTMEGATTCIGKNGNVYIAWAGNEKLYFDKSMDGGKTWNKNKIIVNSAKGWDLTLPDFFRTNGMPFLAIDRKEKLYVCSAFEENKYNKIFIFSSDDEGDSWKNVNFFQQDSTTHYMMPHAFLDETTGNYFVLYYAVKNSQIDVLLSYKLQNDTSFKTIRVNEKSSSTPSKEIFFGDYINVCAVGNTVAMVWTEVENKNTIVKYREMKLK